MTVLVYHVMGRLSFHVDHPTLGAYTARLGNYGVTIFFLLSGFLLYRPFVVAHFESRDRPSWIGVLCPPAGAHHPLRTGWR